MPELLSTALTPRARIGRRDRRRRAIAGLAKALLAGGFLAGSNALAQYPPAGQPYGPAYGAPSSTAYMQPQPDAANQSDEQLLTVARLLEQQGRYAQAQRIYTELERRRLSGQQRPVNPSMSPAFAPPPAAVYQPQALPAPQNFDPRITWQAPQNVNPPIAWQAAPMQMTTPAPVMQMSNSSPVMQFYPQAAAPVYEQRQEMIAPPVPASAPLPPPAPPSEAYVVDREFTPPPKTTSQQPSVGWRSALAPIPAALRNWSVDIPTPYQQQVHASPATAAGPDATSAGALPDLPIGAFAPLDSMGTQFPPKAPPAAQSAPPRFMPPAIASGDERMPLHAETITSTPTTMRMRPTPEGRVDSLDPSRDNAHDLLSQTDSIRIIPGQRGSLQLKPESNHTPIEPFDPPSNGPTPEKPSAQWTPNHIAATTPVERPVPAATERPSAENPPRFKLAALLMTPEFREIHTETVLQGLELLARPEARLRMMGAVRIALAGPEGRTALPVLRNILVSEPEKQVLVHVAETILKIQPNDRAGTACLGELLSNRMDAQLRETAVTALGSAAAGKNPIAIARLTDALDDPNSRVRAAAAGSLALFGPAAVESASRLEGAATSDVPTVQRAAVQALAAIRGSESDAPVGRSPSAVQVPFDLQSTGARPLSSLPGGIPMGRVKLSDEPAGSDEPALPETKTASAPPKLFPTDRIGASHSVLPSPETIDEASSSDAMPVPQKKPSATFPATLPVAPAPAAGAAPANAELLLQLHSTPGPLSPAAASAAPTQPTASSAFLLQSEPGESKAGGSP